LSLSCRAAFTPAKVQPYGLHYWPVCSGGEFQKFAAYRRPQPAGTSFSVERHSCVKKILWVKFSRSAAGLVDFGIVSAPVVPLGHPTKTKPNASIPKNKNIVFHHLKNLLF
jgi:hypothetical protein